MKTNSTNQCPHCGQPISQGIKGLCPNCLALVAFGPEASPAQTVLSDPGRASASFKNPPPAARPLLPNAAKYFGDYELLEEIARGGMGVVYKARQTSLNRIVAVKMILSGQLATEADVKRFRTEAEAAANLQHPNIVAIHETGEHEGRHFFSMDYVEGKNLAQTLDGQPLPAAKAAALLKTIAEAVHFAHQRGTLHRDLKPQNILIDVAGQPRITDFGLAKRLEGNASLTQTGAAMGSPSFMPPEQATGQHHQVGPQSDVYALGAILYQLLTGKPPFAGSTPLETMRQVVETDPTRPSKSHPETPPDLETVCLKCLEKRPERRYHSARELAEELGRFLNREPVLAKPAGTWRKVWTWSLRNPWAIIGTAAVAGIVLLGFAYGLWERVQYLEGKARPHFYDPMVMLAVGWYIAMPAVLFGRWLKARQQRNLPVSNLQLGLLAGVGVLLVAIGLCSDMWVIRIYVWNNLKGAYFFYNLPVVVSHCLGVPLVLCWLGGILIWQSLHRQQARWSGSTAAEAEWLPRQADRYCTPRFVAATIANMVLFVAIGSLGIALGVFEPVLAAFGPSQEGNSLLLTLFVGIALTVSIACWVYATRKVYKRPSLVSVFLGLLFVGSALGWFFAGPSNAPLLVVPAILTGLAGGLLFVKTVKIRTSEPVEPLPPLVMSELFQWDGRALALTLAAMLLAIGLLVGLFFGKESFEEESMVFLAFTFPHALWPACFMAVRATTGKLRELFLSMGMAIVFGAFGVPIFGLMVGFPSSVILPMLAAIPVGIAIAYALIHFGKIRPRPSECLKPGSTHLSNIGC